jgi:short-subunit dehydrogenase
MSKTILITGASSGIGRSTAQLFAEKGWNVSATMRNPRKDYLLRTMKNVICPKVDVTDPVSIRQSINQTVDHFGNIDVLVNNAGYSVTGPFESSTDEQIQKLFDTNVFGLMEFTRQIIPYFRNQKDGVIINISSMGGRISLPFMSLYHSTKWAVEGFSESLQHELSLFNIKVKVIEPGPVKTDFYSRSMDFAKNKNLKIYDEYFDKFMRLTLRSRRMGFEPGKTAEAIYDAATDKRWKTRYPSDAGARGALFLRKILPDSVFNGAIRLFTKR